MPDRVGPSPGSYGGRCTQWCLIVVPAVCERSIAMRNIVQRPLVSEGGAAISFHHMRSAGILCTDSLVPAHRRTCIDSDAIQQRQIRRERTYHDPSAQNMVYSASSSRMPDSHTEVWTVTGSLFAHHQPRCLRPRYQIRRGRLTTGLSRLHNK